MISVAEFRLREVLDLATEQSIRELFKQIPGVQDDIILLEEGALLLVSHDPAIVAADKLGKRLEASGILFTRISIANSKSSRIKVVMDISGMSCSSCVSSVQRTLEECSGVESVSVNLLLGKSTIVCDSDELGTPQNLVDEINSIGFSAVLSSSVPCTDNVTSTFSGETKHVTFDLNSEPATFSVEIQNCVARQEGFIASVKTSMRSTSGVVGCVEGWTSTRGVQLNVMYNPSVVGARTLLRKMLALTPDSSPELMGVPDTEFLNSVSSYLRIADYGTNVGENERKEYRVLRSLFLMSLIPALIVFGLAMAPHNHPNSVLTYQIIPGVSVNAFIMLVLTIPVQFIFGWRFHKHAFKGLRHGIFTMDLLVSINTNFCFFYSLMLMVYSAVVAAQYEAATSVEPGRAMLRGLQHRSDAFFGPNHFSNNNGFIPPLSQVDDIFPMNPSIGMVFTTRPSIYDQRERLPSPLWPTVYANALVQIQPERQATVQSDDTYQRMKLPPSVLHESESAEMSFDPPHFFEVSAVLITVILLGKTLENRARFKTIESLTDLMQRRQKVARILSRNPFELSSPHELVDDGKVDDGREVSSDLLEIGDIIKLIPGDVVPADGRMKSPGMVYVDESVLTGESRPVSKFTQDELLAGSMISSGMVVVEVIRIGAGTTFGKIVALVENASSSRLPIEETANKISQWFIPAVLALALQTLLVWICLTLSNTVQVNIQGEYDAWINEHFGTATKLMFSFRFPVAVLAAACPCALGLAAPTAVVVATGRAASLGILVKSAAPLEAAARAKIVVLDKTGTVTEGRPSVSAVALNMDALSMFTSLMTDLSPALERPLPVDVTTITKGNGKYRFVDYQIEENVLFLAWIWWLMATIERTCSHPLAVCLESFFVDNFNGMPPFPMIENSDHKPGKGVSGTVSLKDDQLVELSLGSLGFCQEVCSETSRRPTIDETTVNDSFMEDWIQDKQFGGSTIVGVVARMSGDPARIVAAVTIHDSVKPQAMALVTYLRMINAEVYMCTGDNTPAAMIVASQIGISPSCILAESTPLDKLRFINQLRMSSATGETGVVMVGDGVNDAPALVEATVGVAVGARADVTNAAADVVLMGNDLQDVATVFSISRKTIRKIRGNFFWALIFNLITLPLAAGVFYPHITINPLLAAILMTSSSLIVVGNSLLLKRVVRVDLDGLAKKRSLFSVDMMFLWWANFLRLLPKGTDKIDPVRHMTVSTSSVRSGGQFSTVLDLNDDLNLSHDEMRFYSS